MASQQKGVGRDADQDKVFENIGLCNCVAYFPDNLFLGENFDRRQLVAFSANIEVFVFFWCKKSVVRDLFFFSAKSCHDHSDEQVSHEKSLNEYNYDEVNETFWRCHITRHLMNLSCTLCLSRDHVPSLSSHYLEHGTASAHKVVKSLVRVNPLAPVVQTIPHSFYGLLLAFWDMLHITAIKLALEQVHAQYR